MASRINRFFADCDNDISDNDVSDDSVVTEAFHTAVRLSYKRSSTKTYRSIETSKNNVLRTNLYDTEESCGLYTSRESKHLDVVVGRSSLSAKLYEAEKKRMEMKWRLDRSRREIVGLEPQQQLLQQNTICQASASISTVLPSTNHHFKPTVLPSPTERPIQRFLPTEISDTSVRTDEWIYHLAAHETCSSSSFSSSISGKEIKPFDGDPKEWHAFADRFKTEVHDVVPNDTLRLLYLRKWLSPEIRQTCVKSSYPHFLKQLRNDYGHPVLVIRACLQALKQVEPVVDDYDIEELTKQIHTTLTVLTKAGCHVDVYSYSLFELSGVTSKLPPTLRREWETWAERVVRAEKLPKLPNLVLLASWLDQLSTK